MGAHKRFDCRFHDQSILSLIVTTLLGVYFTSLQAMEYQEATFSIADSIYGSTFYIATGFHGIHVVVGTIFLIISCARLRLGQLSKSHHLLLLFDIGILWILCDFFCMVGSMDEGLLGLKDRRRPTSINFVNKKINYLNFECI